MMGGEKTTLKAIIDEGVVDVDIIGKYLLAMTHIDTLLSGLLTELAYNCRVAKIDKYEIGHNLKEIRRKLKTMPKIPLKLGEQADEYVYDADRFENIIKAFFGIDNHPVYMIQPKFLCGDRVEFDLNGVSHIGVVHNYHIDAYLEGKNEIRSEDTYTVIAENGMTMYISEDKLKNA